VQVKIIIPNKTVAEQMATKITAPGSEGYFQVLPRHIDYVSSLAAGVLTLFNEESVEYYGINYGLLVKKGDVVYISCYHALKGSSIETLSKTIEKEFSVLDEKEKKTNEILTKMEIDTLKMFMELE
jgi:F-type H+-transporting ATPase subunit epsilon